MAVGGRSWGAPDNFAVGMHAPGTGDAAVHRVWRPGRAARVEDLGQVDGRWPKLAHARGFTTSAGVPIVIRGELWGALIVVGRDQGFPAAIEEHLSTWTTPPSWSRGPAGKRRSG